MKNSMIETLRSDKLRLQQQVAHLEELLKQHATKEEQQDEQVKPGIQLFMDRPKPPKVIIHVPQDLRHLKSVS